MSQDYGLWPLVVINSVLLIVFAASFFHPHSLQDWRAMGGNSAFIVALSGAPTVRAATPHRQAET